MLHIQPWLVASDLQVRTTYQPDLGQESRLGRFGNETTRNPFPFHPWPQYPGPPCTPQLRRCRCQYGKHTGLLYKASLMCFGPSAHCLRPWNFWAAQKSRKVSDPVLFGHCVEACCFGCLLVFGLARLKSSDANKSFP